MLRVRAVLGVLPLAHIPGFAMGNEPEAERPAAWAVTAPRLETEPALQQFAVLFFIELSTRKVEITRCLESWIHSRRPPCTSTVPSRTRSTWSEGPHGTRYHSTFTPLKSDARGCRRRQCSVFTIYGHFPKLGVAGSSPVSRSIFSKTCSFGPD